MTIPAYKDIAEKFFGTLWQEAQPADWALVAWKLSEQRAEVVTPSIRCEGKLQMRADHLTVAGIELLFDGRLPQGTVEVREKYTDRLLCTITNVAAI